MSSHRKVNSRRKSFIAIALTLGVFGLASCSQPQTGQSEAQLPELVLPPQDAVIIQDPYSEYAHNLSPRLRAACAALRWTHCDIPEFTDDQAFMDKPTTFGPHAFVIPSKNLATWTDADFADPAPKLVAFVDIQIGGTLPSSYTDLGLVVGMACFYVRFDGAQYRGWVAPASGTACSETMPGAAVEYTVKAAALPTGGTYTANDIPPVARFHEVSKGGQRGYPAVGMRSGSKWVIVLPTAPAGTTVDTLPMIHKPAFPPSRTADIYGWNDIQTLALPSASSPGVPERSTMKASVVATPELRNYNVPNGHWPVGFAHAATVYFRTAPQGKYKDTWKFRTGLNLIFLKRVTNGKYEAELRHLTLVGGGTDARNAGAPTYVVTTTKTLTVRWHKHSIWPPSTARFLWSPGDEDIWVACEDGCCMVSSS